jgi:arginine/serine-rich splicing factor 1/9
MDKACTSKTNLNKEDMILMFLPGLPPTGSWQDLKDHMREAGDVAFADVYKDGTGMVEFLRKQDMKYAVKKLDGTKFRSHEVSDLRSVFL